MALPSELPPSGGRRRAFHPAMYAPPHGPASLPECRRLRGAQPGLCGSISLCLRRGMEQQQSKPHADDHPAQNAPPVLHRTPAFLLPMMSSSLTVRPVFPGLRLGIALHLVSLAERNSPQLSRTVCQKVRTFSRGISEVMVFILYDKLYDLDACLRQTNLLE
jgi:hypothetical protein